ncbi:MAG TPA: hypothetical protein VIH61_05325 [Waddliaceae bacterium]
MSYTPKSDEQLDKEGLMQPQTCDFEIKEATQGPSKSSGNLMITLALKVFDAEGNSQTVWDYIVFGTNFGERKFKYAAKACGLLNEYNAGTLVYTDFEGKNGKCEIAIQEAQNGYGAKNIIKEYIDKEGIGEAPVKKEKPEDDPFGDSIPF